MYCRAVRRIAVLPTLVGLVLAASLTGCAAPAPPPAPRDPLPSVSVPTGGVSLAQLGFRNGPADLVTLPAGVRLGLRVDQPNMLTATVIAPEATVVADWLRTHLSEGEFEITADGDGGVVFEGHGWEGAFTASNAEAALTLRRQPADR